MKKFLCILAAAAVLTVCAACGVEGAKPVGSIPNVTKGYFEGFEEASSVTLNLDDYVNANGTEITYSAISQNVDVATVEVEGSMLTATLHAGEGNSRITVDVNSNGKKAFDLSFTITAATVSAEYKRVACVGDSLTYGHSWHNQSYPVYLQEMLGDGIEVQNFGVNGSAVTNRSESTYTLKYDTLKEYTNSLTFAPDVVIIMLGSNDGYNWTGSEPTFDEEYEKLINSYFEWGAKEVILLTSPPTLEGNAFNIPDDVIREQVCPRQREMAANCSLPLVDVRAAFEAHENMRELFRPGDGVHFSVDGAQLVAQLVAEALVRL